MNVALTAAEGRQLTDELVDKSTFNATYYGESPCSLGFHFLAAFFSKCFLFGERRKRFSNLLPPSFGDAPDEKKCVPCEEGEKKVALRNIAAIMAADVGPFPYEKQGKKKELLLERKKGKSFSRLS